MGRPRTARQMAARLRTGSAGEGNLKRKSFLNPERSGARDANNRTEGSEHDETMTREQNRDRRISAAKAGAAEMRKAKARRFKTNGRTEGKKQ